MAHTMDYVINLLLMKGKFFTKSASKSLHDTVHKIFQIQTRLSQEYEKASKIGAPFNNMMDFINFNASEYSCEGDNFIVTRRTLGSTLCDEITMMKQQQEMSRTTSFQKETGRIAAEKIGDGIHGPELVPVITSPITATQKRCREDEYVVEDLSAILKSQAILFKNMSKLISILEKDRFMHNDIRKLDKIKKKLEACTDILADSRTNSKVNFHENIISDLIEEEITRCRFRHGEIKTSAQISLKKPQPQGLEIVLEPPRKAPSRKSNKPPTYPTKKISPMKFAWGDRKNEIMRQRHVDIEVRQKSQRFIKQETPVKIDDIDKDKNSLYQGNKRKKRKLDATLGVSDLNEKSKETPFAWNRGNEVLRKRQIDLEARHSSKKILNLSKSVNVTSQKISHLLDESKSVKIALACKKHELINKQRLRCEVIGTTLDVSKSETIVTNSKDPKIQVKRTTNKAHSVRYQMGDRKNEVLRRRLIDREAKRNARFFLKTSSTDLRDSVQIVPKPPAVPKKAMPSPTRVKLDPKSLEESKRLIETTEGHFRSFEEKLWHSVMTSRYIALKSEYKDLVKCQFYNRRQFTAVEKKIADQMMEERRAERDELGRLLVVNQSVFQIMENNLLFESPAPQEQKTRSEVVLKEFQKFESGSDDQQNKVMAPIPLKKIDESILGSQTDRKHKIAKHDLPIMSQGVNESSKKLTKKALGSPRHRMVHTNKNDEKIQPKQPDNTKGEEAIPPQLLALKQEIEEIAPVKLTFTPRKESKLLALKREIEEMASVKITFAPKKKESSMSPSLRRSKTLQGQPKMIQTMRQSQSAKSKSNTLPSKIPKKITHTPKRPVKEEAAVMAKNQEVFEAFETTLKTVKLVTPRQENKLIKSAPRTNKIAKVERKKMSTLSPSNSGLKLDKQEEIPVEANLNVESDTNEKKEAKLKSPVPNFILVDESQLNVTVNKIAPPISPETPLITTAKEPEIPFKSNSKEPEVPLKSISKEPEVPLESISKEPEVLLKSISKEPEVPLESISKEPEVPLKSISKEPEIPLESIYKEPKIPLNTTSEEQDIPLRTISKEQDLNPIPQEAQEIPLTMTPKEPEQPKKPQIGKLNPNIVSVDKRGRIKIKGQVPFEVKQTKRNEQDFQKSKTFLKSATHRVSHKKLVNAKASPVRRIEFQSRQTKASDSANKTVPKGLDKSNSLLQMRRTTKSAMKKQQVLTIIPKVHGTDKETKKKPKVLNVETDEVKIIKANQDDAKLVINPRPSSATTDPNPVSNDANKEQPGAQKIKVLYWDEEEEAKIPRFFE